MSDKYRTETQEVGSCEVGFKHTETVTIRIHRCRPPMCVQCGGTEPDARSALIVRVMTDDELAGRTQTSWPSWVG